MKKEFSFTLLENARDSLFHAVTYLSKEKKNISEFKRALLDLSHVTELIFKERLHRIHPCLVLENINDYGKKEEPKTVSFLGAVDRVQYIAEVDLQNKMNGLKIIVKLRNKLLHYELKYDLEELKTIILTF